MQPCHRSRALCIFALPSSTQPRRSPPASFPRLQLFHSVSSYLHSSKWTFVLWYDHSLFENVDTIFFPFITVHVPASPTTLPSIRSRNITRGRPRQGLLGCCFIQTISLSIVLNSCPSIYSSCASLSDTSSARNASSSRSRRNAASNRPQAARQGFCLHS